MGVDEQYRFFIKRQRRLLSLQLQSQGRLAEGVIGGLSMVHELLLGNYTLEDRDLGRGLSARGLFEGLSLFFILPREVLRFPLFPKHFP